MKSVITFKDHGSRSVELLMDFDPSKEDRNDNVPTPAAILTMAVKAMFENGMLARAGQIALEGASKGINPAEAIQAHFIERN